MNKRALENAVVFFGCVVAIYVASLDQWATASVVAAIAVLQAYTIDRRRARP